LSQIIGPATAGSAGPVPAPLKSIDLTAKLSKNTARLGDVQ